MTFSDLLQVVGSFNPFQSHATQVCYIQLVTRQNMPGIMGVCKTCTRCHFAFHTVLCSVLCTLFVRCLKKQNRVQGLHKLDVAIQAHDSETGHCRLEQQVYASRSFIQVQAWACRQFWNAMTDCLITLHQQFAEQYNERFGGENSLDADCLELKNTKYEHPIFWMMCKHGCSERCICASLMMMLTGKRR